MQLVNEWAYACGSKSLFIETVSEPGLAQGSWFSHFYLAERATMWSSRTRLFQQRSPLVKELAGTEIISTEDRVVFP